MRSEITCYKNATQCWSYIVMEAQSMQKKIAPLFLGGTLPFFCFSGPIQFGVSPQHFCLTLNLIRKSKLFRKSRRCQLLIQFSEFQCYETSFLVLKMFCVNDGSNISNLKWHLVYSFPSHLPKFLFNLYLLSTGLSTAVRGCWSFISFYSQVLSPQGRVKHWQQNIF